MTADDKVTFRMFPLWTKLFIIIFGLLVLTSVSTNIVSGQLFSTELRFQMQNAGLDTAAAMVSDFQDKIHDSVRNSESLLMLTRRLPTTLRNEAAEGFFYAHPEILNISSSDSLSFSNNPLISAVRMEEDRLNSYIASALNGSLPKYGRPVIDNISPAFDLPLLAVRYAATPDSPTLLLILFSDQLRQSLATQSLKASDPWSSRLLLSATGHVLIHPDLKINNSGASYADLPLWREALRDNTADNLQGAYLHEGVSYWGSLYKGDSLDVISFVSRPLKESFAVVHALNRINVYIVGIVLSLALIFIYFFTRTLTKPLEHLLAATQQIRQGNYTITVPYEGRDEIGELNQSFKLMTAGLIERERIKTAFGRFVNKDLAEKALKNDLHLGGETRQAAVLFADIRSFTALSETMTPSALINFLNDYMSRMVTCVGATGGSVDKFIGDAIMAVWGLRDNMGNVVKGAVDAALLMRETLNSYNLKRSSMGEEPIRIGCGISYGPVVAGQMGSADRMEYTVIGDTVNVASRTEALTKNFGVDILITEEAYKQVSGIYLVRPLEKIHIRGKAERQQLYVVEGRVKSNFESISKNISELRLRLSSTLKPTSEIRPLPTSLNDADGEDF